MANHVELVLTPLQATKKQDVKADAERSSLPAPCHAWTLKPFVMPQVSAFGGEGRSDTGDIWVVDWDKGDAAWTQDQRVQLMHRDTSQYLASGPRQFGRPISGQFEIFAKGKKAADTLWTATEGVFFPPRSSGSEL